MSKKTICIVISAFLTFSLVIPLDRVKADAPIPKDPIEQPSNIIAFPGAEGGGRFTSGGRGYDVYEVTTLEDYSPSNGEKSIKGSFRDAVSQGNRNIIFRVSGAIHLKERVKLKVNNLTIAGQTAPGDGVCLADYLVDCSGCQNVIIRYLRFRPGSAHIDLEPDGFGGRDMNYMMVDHISTSWSTDETLSLYRCNNLTVQWSMAYESLTLSGHIKGRHGYGGVWGGNNSTWSHNIIAHHTSREPRIGGGQPGDNKLPAYLDVKNNVLYDWGFNSMYGGDTSHVNVMNNYYKAGPGTRAEVKTRIAQPGVKGKPSEWYFSGNYMEGAPEVTDNNLLGLQDYTDCDATIQNNPISTGNTDSTTMQSATVAYSDVLAKAGDSFPRRDAADARVVADIKNGTGRFINREYEVGGYPELNTYEVPVDTDKDGMPDEWEKFYGLNPNDSSDGRKASDGTTGDPNKYTNLETYLNSIVDENYAPDNPEVYISTPEINSIQKAGGNIKIVAKASDKDGIDKVEFFNGSEKIGESTKAPYSYSWNSVSAGTYFITARATDKMGNSTQSTSMPIYVNEKNVSGTWNSKDIGKVTIKGNGSLNESGQLTVKGAGKITGKADSFHYVYQKMTGDAALVAKLNSIALLDNNAISGLMIRETLDEGSKAALISTSIVKADKDEDKDGGENDTYYGTYFSSRMTKSENIKTLDFNDYPQEKPGLPALVDSKLPIWLKLERVGNSIIASTSYDGTTWNQLAKQTFNMGSNTYIGFAVDATQTSSDIIYYNTAKFSDISLTTSK
ncbi:hypothetical protein CLPUN_27850 [Clostridium puniceum]|uniref:Pectate trisaccharide-lyase n=1 Tax=Clostridium puniceum TaxID=29367 RepID=A0A1S8TF88_9CLOT|nr:Ig-like domain-containing protein [Clostridium puniceum]OOM76284.1 hypothetical protein CLPUN_27850 [Clostridium puniceum]